MLRLITTAAAIAVATVAAFQTLHAQAPPQQPPAPRPTESRVGLDLFGAASIGWPASKDSFDALQLSATPFEVGGGARITGLWRDLFIQVAASHWSDDGERAFIDEDGTPFLLGIPLEVDATFIDATIGVKTATRTSSGRISFISYVGAGAGVVRYRERSPFAEPGDDLDTNKASYHALVGVELPLARRIAFAVDGRFRYIPQLLGDAGASAVFDEDFLGGFNLSAGLRFGFGGPPPMVPPARPTTPGTAQPQRTEPPAPEKIQTVILASAPVFLTPDATRVPLRTLPAGTAVLILEDKGDWIRIEFIDQQYGRRVGFVERKYVQIR